MQKHNRYMGQKGQQVYRGPINLLVHKTNVLSTKKASEPGARGCTPNQSRRRAQLPAVAGSWPPANVRAYLALSRHTAELFADDMIEPTLVPKIRFGVAGKGAIRLNQCGACRLVFGGLNAFDKHRRDFQCRDPIEAGLRISMRRSFVTEKGSMEFDIWSRPPPPMARAGDGNVLEGVFPESEGGSNPVDPKSPGGPLQGLQSHPDIPAA